MKKNYRCHFLCPYLLDLVMELLRLSINIYLDLAKFIMFR